MGHVVKAKERAEVKRYGGRLHLSIALSHSGDSHPTSLIYVHHFLFVLPWCSRLALLYQIFFSLEVWRRPPPAATEDNYTNTDKSASNSYTLKSWGFCRMQLATISNACAKQKNWYVRSRTKKGVNGVPRAGETRDDEKRKEDRITSPTEPLTSTHWGQKNHTCCLKFKSQYFFFFFLS